MSFNNLLLQVRPQTCIVYQQLQTVIMMRSHVRGGSSLYIHYDMYTHTQSPSAESDRIVEMWRSEGATISRLPVLELEVQIVYWYLYFQVTYYCWRMLHYVSRYTLPLLPFLANDHWLFQTSQVQCILNCFYCCPKWLSNISQIMWWWLCNISIPHCINDVQKTHLKNFGN